MKLNFKTFFIVLPLLIVLGLVLMSSKIVDYFNNSSPQVENSQKAVQEITNLLLQIDQITFDTSVLASGYFRSVKSLPYFPMDQSSNSFGKQNPFSSSFIINPGKVATTTVGGIIPSGSRAPGQVGLTSVDLSRPSGIATTTRRTTGRR